MQVPAQCATAKSLVLQQQYLLFMLSSCAFSFAASLLAVCVRLYCLFCISFAQPNCMSCNMLPVGVQKECGEWVSKACTNLGNPICIITNDPSLGDSCFAQPEEVCVLWTLQSPMKAAKIEEFVLPPPSPFQIYHFQIYTNT